MNFWMLFHHFWSTLYPFIFGCFSFPVHAFPVPIPNWIYSICFFSSFLTLYLFAVGCKMECMQSKLQNCHKPLSHKCASLIKIMRWILVHTFVRQSRWRCVLSIRILINKSFAHTHTGTQTCTRSSALAHANPNDCMCGSTEKWLQLNSNNVGDARAQLFISLNYT